MAFTRDDPEPKAVVAPGELADEVDVSLGVAWRAINYPSGYEIAEHKHPAAQFVFASQGVMTVTVSVGTWIVPTNRAVWIPAHESHSIRMTGPVAMRTLYVAPTVSERTPETCCLVSVSPLLRELILDLMSRSSLYDRNSLTDRLIQVALDLIEELPTSPLHLPLPRSRALRRVADEILARPGRRRPIEAWAQLAAMSPRSLMRRFRDECGMSLGRWHKQAVVQEALRRLGRGEAVTTVGLELGYASTSAFIVMFRKMVGTTPGRYFSKSS